MKQLTDEVLAQVRDALASARVYMNHVAVANWQTPAVICSEAIAALDTAQPVQVNAILVEALEKLQRHDFEMRSKTGDGFAPYVVRIIDDAVAAAKQAQPDGINDVYLKGYEAGKQAQPERVPSDEFLQMAIISFGLLIQGDFDLPEGAQELAKRAVPLMESVLHNDDDPIAIVFAAINEAINQGG